MAALGSPPRSRRRLLWALEPPGAGLAPGCAAVRALPRPCLGWLWLTKPKTWG